MSNSNWLIIGAVICQFAAHQPALAEASHDLTITVSGATPGTGQILTTLFNSADSYMNEPYREAKTPVDDAGISTIVFNDLPAAAYAVSIVYDWNSDGRLDTNLFGIPSEAFGFSNGATAFFGPPDWDDARFSLQGDLAIEIKLETAK
ncbi:MAG: DUF2141 domain-containing protein [Geminicoccaceae bacterium]